MTRMKLPGPWPDLGNLFLRVGTGTMMVVHGWPKLVGGEALWQTVGAGISNAVGIHFWPVFWGIVVAIVQTFGGFMIALGFLTRPAALALALLMSIAAFMVFQKSGGDFRQWSHPAEAAITCFALFLMGAGRFSLGKKAKA